MFRKIGLVIIAALFGLHSSAQVKLPTIEEVASKFYNTYDVYSLEYPSVAFEKRKTSWKVTTQKYEDGSLKNIATYLFYDLASKSYSKLPIAKKNDAVQVDYKSHLDDYQISAYTLHHYYGYRGWYKDVIAELSPKKTLPDSALYSLARAYDYSAIALLGRLSDEAIEEDVFKLPITRNCMNAQQIQQFGSIMKQSLDCFAKLAKQNKRFETIVGNIAIKLANETVYEFHTYLTYATEYSKTFQLPDQLYPDSVIQKTKKVLEACPKDAILLSLGDNDFYPVLYVQHKLGIRKDVYLVNQSLLGLERFILMSTFQQFNAMPIKISVEQKSYAGRTNDVLMMKESDSLMALDDVIHEIKNGKRNEYGYVSLPTNSFAFKRKLKQQKDNNGITLFTVSDVKLKLSGKYLLKNDWLVLDILNNLNGRRFCCQSPLFGYLEGLNKYFTQVGDDLFVF